MQTPFERVPAPQYEQRPDVAVYALTLQIPLEGRLMRGGIVGVIKTASGQWIHSQQHGHQPDFFISTREVNPTLWTPPPHLILYYHDWQPCHV